MRIMYLQQTVLNAGNILCKTYHTKTKNAEATLRAHSISTKEELIKIQKETETQKEKLSLTNNDDLKQISQID